MRAVRLVIRLVRVLAMVYGAWVAIRKSRWVAITLALWGLLRGAPHRNPRKMADFLVSFSGEPAIYRRKGWRRIVPRISRMDG